ncbi:MAG TPA: hypothetical protein VM434_06225 [Beijerinckiaceae bacterium]|nr:hypothetical protein [Beijerinckiaceae bacterium]
MSIARLVDRVRGKGTSVTVRLGPDELARLDAWIAQQPEPKPSRPEAIRRLIDLGSKARTRGRPGEFIRPQQLSSENAD